MAYTNKKEIEKMVNETKKKYGKDLHFMMVIYNSEDGKQLMTTKYIGTNSVDAIIGILDRTKLFISESVNNILEKKKIKPVKNMKR